ncbi:MAG: family 20 glycosylhydrolase [Bacteroidetes bacterium]|nr:family 20 glycosylhydrolase [Bacteroidota bacterium]
MKKILLFNLCLLFVASSWAQELSIIPQPVLVQSQPGSFILKNNFTVGVSSNDEVTARVVNYITKKLSVSTGFAFSTGKIEKNSIFRFHLSRLKNSELGTEGYQLNVYPDSVSITANQPAGLFYAVQTFLQLLPKEIESKDPVKNFSWSAPCVRITDYPRFAWRGLMLDVSRHFFTKDQVKQFIDEMVRYKYNRFHWHLTDDEGWRIEIKSLPKLTQVGAWRVPRVGRWAEFSPPTPDEPRNYGGFYTQEEIKEVVQYAKDNFVEVLPEIDMPGHSLAFIASYPEICGTPGTYQVNSGERLIDWTLPGHPAVVNNTIDPSNEKAYELIDKVMGEVANLFPFEYIHMGGDECSKNFWEKNESIAKLMKKEKLQDMNEVQSYFVKRMEKIIESKKKKMIGWDEILEGGLKGNAAVMSWRGSKGGIEAAKLGHQVVMSPNDFAYLDLRQGDALTEPPIYSSVRLNQSYRFEPVPEGVDPKLILGGQGNLWSERLTTWRSVQYMVYPRALSIAETLWSPKESKNWDSFVRKTENHFKRLDVSETKYSTALYDCVFEPQKDDHGKLQIELSTEISGLDIFYTFDETNPDQFYPKYVAPLSVPKDAVTLKVVTYRNRKQIGKQINMPIDELKKRAGIK